MISSIVCIRARARERARRIRNGDAGSVRARSAMSHDIENVNEAKVDENEGSEAIKHGGGGKHWGMGYPFLGHFE